MDRLAWLMTIAAAAGMTAYADGLERRGEPGASAEARPAQAKTPAPRNEEGAETSGPAG